MIAVIGTAVAVALRWDFSAKVVPLVVGTVALTAAALSLFNDMCRKPEAAATEGLAGELQHGVEQRIHMDLDLRHRPPAGARDHRAGGLVLRLSHRLHGGDGRSSG